MPSGEVHKAMTNLNYEFAASVVLPISKLPEIPHITVILTLSRRKPSRLENIFCRD
jgi:hypothetical protein